MHMLELCNSTHNLYLGILLYTVHSKGPLRALTAEYISVCKKVPFHIRTKTDSKDCWELSLNLLAATVGPLEKKKKKKANIST